MAVLAAIAFPASAVAALPGHVIGKQGTASGQFAIASAQAAASHPHALDVRAVGHVDGIEIVFSCSRGFNVSARSVEHSSAGVFRLPITPRSDRCDVTASVSGEGKVHVEVRAA